MVKHGQRKVDKISQSSARVAKLGVSILVFIGLLSACGRKVDIENAPVVKELRNLVNSLQQKVDDTQKKVDEATQNIAKKAGADQIDQVNKKLEKLAALEQEVTKLRAENIAYQTRIDENMRYHTQQITALKDSQRNAEANLAQSIEQAKGAIAKRIDQDISPVIDYQNRADANFLYLTKQLNEVSSGTQQRIQEAMKAHDAQVDKKLAAIQQQTGELSKNVSSHQTRTNDNILYLTQGLNVLGLFQKSMEGQLVKAADQAKATVQQVEQKLAPVNAQLESLADFQTRTEGNILYHTKQMAGLNELQRNAETKLAQVVDQAKAAVQQVAQKIDGQLKAFSDNVATQQARANENIIFHAQKITSIENGQKDQAALVSKNLGDIKQQVTNLKKEMDTQLINMNKSLKESTEAQLTSLKKETDTQLTSMNKTLKEATDTRIAEVNKSVEAFKESAKTQLTEVNDKVGTLSREVNDLKDGTESRFGKVEAVVNASNEQIADVKTDLEEKANEVDKSLQLVTQEVNGLKDFSAGVRSQLSNIEEDLNAATQRIRNIAREAEESAKSRLADMEKDLDSLNRKVSDITGFQDSVKTRVAEIGRDLTALTQRVDLTSSAGAKSELNALLAKATENLNALDRQMGRFEEFNEMAKSYFDRVNTNLAGLTQQVATFAEFKDNTKSHLARVDESLGRVNQQMAGFSEFKETARARLSEVDGRLNNLILSYERSIIERAPVAAPPKQ